MGTKKTAPTRTPVKGPLRTPVKGPVRTPVKGPVRTPIKAGSDAEQAVKHDGLSDSDLAKRVKAKVNTLPPSTETFEPQFIQGLSSLFGDAPIEDFSQEELEERATFSVHGDDPTWDAMTSQLIKSSCAFTAQEILTGPNEAPYFGKFLIGDHHIDWDEKINKYKRLCILAARDHGKCQRGDDLLLTAKGERVRVDEWKGGELIVWDDSSRRFVPSQVPASRPNGVKPVYRVKLRTGRELRLTEEHPLRMWGGWVATKDLEVGQRVAVARELSGIGQNRVEDAWLLGALAGDGGLSGDAVNITKKDLKFVNAVKDAIRGKGWKPVVHKDGITYRFTRFVKGVETAKDWAIRYGIMGKKSIEKTVPQSIFTATDEGVADFLAGYFDADGSVEWCTLEYYSTSKELLEGVQHLLTRLGVISRLRRKKGKYKGKAHISWRLAVGSEHIVKFAEKIHLRGSKAVQLQRLVTAQKSRLNCSGMCVDRFPKDVWDELKKGDYWHRQNGGTRIGRQYSPTRQKLQKIADQEDNTELKSWLASPVFWDEVVEIEELEPVETWALQVPKYHAYVSNDVVNHNTFFVDFAYPIWKAINLPRGSGFIFSATQEQAERILGDIKEEIESNPKLAWLIPKKKDKWGSRSIRLSNGHRIYARGFGTRVRGAHPDYIIVDDGLNDETAYSETVRQKQKDYFFTAISNMIVPGGQIIVIGTPFHADDLYAELRENPQYHFASYPAESNPGQPDNRALWPERYSLETLAEKLEEIKSIRYTREFLCEPVSDDMSLFPLHLFQGTDVEQFNLTLGMPYEFWKEAGITPYMGVDFAMSTNVQADFTVVWVVGVDKRGNRWLIDMKREKGLPYQQQLSLINTLGRKYQPALIFLEDNQMQRIFGDELIRTSDLPIKKFTTGVQKNSLDKGVPSLRILLENAKFRIPRGDADTIALMDTWITEMRSITWLDGKIQSVGSHDDTVMALWICDQAIRTGGFQFTFGTENDYDDTSKESMDELMAELTGESTESDGDQTVNLV